ncbi:hypothetical protein DL96DRAFT_1469389 [Flagelloscypha sp. PMI_526]|nr:hypothetical protein DL96DRAFT_1469389 [Flagelloscypha sp. PMI_526]
MPLSLGQVIHILIIGGFSICYIHKQFLDLGIDGEYSHTTGASASLAVLRETMRRLADDEKLTEDEALPCKYFDLIMGSGHGGWVALMLGRLGMPISRAMQAYKSILERITQINLSAQDKAQLFEFLVKRLVCEETGCHDLEEPRLEDDASFQTHCRTAILASTIGNLSAPALFRTYHARNNRRANCFISEAIRASSTPLTSPVTIDGERFVSSSHFGHSNAIDFALSETAKIFPNAETQLIISIGSGHPGHTSFEPHVGSSYEEATIRLAQDAERRSEEFARRADSSIFYYRFNVEQGLQAYCADAENIQGTILTHANAYLDREEVSRRLDAAISQLRGKSSQPRMSSCHLRGF